MNDQQLCAIVGAAGSVRPTAEVSGRALTLWAEWAYAVAWLGKPIENRQWKAPDWLVGKRFAIHAGATIGGRKGRVALSEAIGAVTMTAQRAGWSHHARRTGHHLDSVTLWRGSTEEHEEYTLDANIQTSAIVCTVVLDRCERNKGQEPPPWASPDSKWWWHLRDVEVLEAPVACRGKLGLWKLTG